MRRSVTGAAALAAGAAMMALAGCGDADTANVPVSDRATLEAASANMAEGAPKVTESAPDTAAAAAPAKASADKYVGQWNGPEGLFMHIEETAPGRFRITNRDTLDRQVNYEGRIVDGTLRFTRDGVERTVRPGTGAETGFKWLADKTDCLIVEAGVEGYCGG